MPWGNPEHWLEAMLENENQKGLYVHQRNVAFCSAKGVAFTALSSKGTLVPQTLNLEVVCPKLGPKLRILLGLV